MGIRGDNNRCTYFGEDGVKESLLFKKIKKSFAQP
jgi:hypothetical protein